MTSDFFLGPLKFKDVELSLLKPATGMRDGEDVTFGTVRVLVTSHISLFGKKIGQVPLILSSRGPTYGLLTADDTFSITAANFKIGSQSGTLSLEPAPVTFTLGQ